MKITDRIVQSPLKFMLFSGGKMKIRLSEHFTYGKLMRFVFPSIIMMIFTSIYGVVDGIFVSNFVGQTPFAAVNLVMPLVMVFGGIGFMLGTGGTALVAKTFGEGKDKRANELFSMLIVVTIIIGIVVGVVGLFLIRPVSILFGAEGEMLEDCVTYGSIILIGTASFMLQNVFQSFLITAEKPKLGLAVTVAAGVTNMFLDWLFMAIFEWGVAGAAIATTISQIVGGIIPLIYFLRPNSSQLRLVKPVFDFRALGQACANGSSEMMSSISASIVNMLYNFQLMKYVGNSGVAAYGVIMYVNFIFVAVFIGYSIGVAPIVGYHYGAGNHPELKNLFRKSLVIIGSSGVIITALAILLSPELASIFVGYNPELTELTQRGLVIYSCAFIFTGFNIFGSRSSPHSTTVLFRRSFRSCERFSSRRQVSCFFRYSSTSTVFGLRSLWRNSAALFSQQYLSSKTEANTNIIDKKSKPVQGLAFLYIVMIYEAMQAYALLRSIRFGYKAKHSFGISVIIESLPCNNCVSVPVNKKHLSAHTALRVASGRCFFQFISAFKDNIAPLF